MKFINILFVFLFSTSLAFSQLSENVGIGVRLQIDSTKGYKIPIVLEVIPGGPAQSAGLKAGDMITRVSDNSTKDLPLAETVELIVGEEGTSVKIAVDRGGSQITFDIVRRKYQFAESYFSPAKKDDEFCSSLTVLMNDASYDFRNTMDSTRFIDEEGAFGRRFYESNVKVTGAEKVSIISSFGKSAQIEFGSFQSTDEVNGAGEKTVSSIKGCYPDFYYVPVSGSGNNNSVQIGKNNTDGFNAAILELYSPEPKPGENLSLVLRINGGETTRYYNVPSPSVQNTFAASVVRIYDDILLNYEHVKGEKHVVAGEMFSMGYTWYEISPMPDGAHDCTLMEGGLSMSNGCNCRFYLGTDQEVAQAAYDKLYDMMFTSLGSEFVFSFEKPELDMTIPEGTESVIVFGKKKKRSYESMPLIALCLIRMDGGQYGVNMYFHDFGF